MAVEAAGGTPVGLVALPGEKLSKAAQARLDAAAGRDRGGGRRRGTRRRPSPAEADEAEGQRRRRRRGGRGRGRGRGRGEGEAEPETGGARTDAAATERVGSPPLTRARTRRSWKPSPGRLGPRARGPSGPSGTRRSARPGARRSRRPRSTSRTRMSRRSRSTSSPSSVGHPAGGGGRGRGGARGGYASAVDRERYGRGGSSGGVNRYPDVSGRGGRPAGGGGQGGRGGPRREPRRDRPVRRVAATGSRPGWPPAARTSRGARSRPSSRRLLRAQLAAKGDGRPAEGSRGRTVPRRAGRR